MYTNDLITNDTNTTMRNWQALFTKYKTLIEFY